MKNLEEQIRQWNDENEFEKCVEAIEAVPEAERGYELTLLLGRAYSNIAVLGPHCERPDGDADKVDRELLDKAISIFESIRAGGESDPFWNSRMAYALWMADGREAEALKYAERWLELAPGDEDAQKLLGHIHDFLACDDEETPDGEEPFTLETYGEADWDVVEEHIQKYFGDYDEVMHEIASEGIHLDVCVIPPREEHNYYTLVTLGMGAHKMNVPEELADQKHGRAELLINLPPDWNLTKEAFDDDKWFWPIRILKSTARYPLRDRDTWLGWGHTLGDDDGVPFSDDTKLCGALLLSPGVFGEDSYTCRLADGDEVNFYQLIPLYKEEIDFKREHGVDELLEKCSDETLEVIDPQRLNVITDADKIDYDDALMESAEEYAKTIEEKKLPVDELAAYNHLAIYLRWCIEHDLMSNPFLRSHGETVEAVKKGELTDLREFMRDDDNINGKLSLTYFNHEGTEFAKWYSWGSRATPYAYIKREGSRRGVLRRGAREKRGVRRRCLSLRAVERGLLPRDGGGNRPPLRAVEGARRKSDAGEKFRDKARGYKASAQRLGGRGRVLRERQDSSRRLQGRVLREIQAVALRRGLEKRLAVPRGRRGRRVSRRRGQFQYLRPEHNLQLRPGDNAVPHALLRRISRLPQA